MSDNVLLARLLQEGLRLHQGGNLAEAEGRYRAVLAQELDNADALHYLGLIAFQNKRYDSAVDLIAKSIAAAGDNAAAHSNLANALTMLGRLPEAEAALDQALRIDPRFADAAFNRGNVLRQQERLADAENAYRQAIAIDANHVGALNNLAQLLELRGDRVQAAAAHYALGNALNDLGRHQDAAQAYDRSLALAHHPGVELKRLLNIPVIPASPAQIDEMRTRLFSDIASFGARGLHLPDPLPYASAAIFYTGYHGRNDRELRKVLADLYIKTCPDLEWRAPHCTRYAGPSGKIRVGFISRFLARGHPIGKHYAAIMDKIDRSRFEVVALRIDASNSASPEADTRNVALRDDLAAARQAIAAERLDVLFYTDIGMEPTTYFLAFARLAPVQCVTLGHPVTTGIPNIDYFLSADVLEPADAAEHYSETLIRMVNISSYFTRRAVTGIPPRRADLGLPVDARLYVCGQNPIKFHPEFDSAIGEILRRDPQGLLVLFHGVKTERWGALLLQRLRAHIPDVANRIVFLPFLANDAFLGFLQNADAVLDTPHFSGGTTSFESFAAGVPIVTWPGRYARSRVTAALYREMGVVGLTAENGTQFVDLALRLAHDPPWRAQKQAELRQKSAVLYENLAAVRELEAFFAAAVAAAAEGRKVQDWPAHLPTDPVVRDL